MALALQKDASSLTGAISSFSPWTSRSATPAAKDDQEAAEASASDGSGKQPMKEQKDQQQGRDHTISRTRWLSAKNYPKDCPPLLVQWFHAVDVPKRKPYSEQNPTSVKPPALPKKYVPFSKTDSRAIENTFQKLLTEGNDEARKKLHEKVEMKRRMVELKPDSSLEGGLDAGAKVPVNEDYLFDVDVNERELGPAYWLGPVYDVRRGSWFFAESAGLRPCDENLAAQLEEGFLKVKPWALATAGKPRSASQPRPQPTKVDKEDGTEDVEISVTNEASASSQPVTPKASMEQLKDSAREPRSPSVKAGKEETTPSRAGEQTYRLFGAHMNSLVTYQDSNTAWLVTDDFTSRMSGPVYERFMGGSHFAGVKLYRGFSDPTKEVKTKDKDSVNPTSKVQIAGRSDGSTDNTIASDVNSVDKGKSAKDAFVPRSERTRQTLERKMSAFVTSATQNSLEQQEEEARQREEEEIQDDYKDADGENQGREVEHLILVTHGIGQRLGLRLESVNFVHDVNTLRKTMKAVYAASPDLLALNDEVEKQSKNSRIQVLPICWRQLLDFPKQSLKYNRTEHDLGDVDTGEEEYPSLEDITIEGVPAVRNLISDLALDILLYQSPAYKGHLSSIVARECNRIYKLFIERNPSFKGKVSLVGHSLGSAIMFDILCQQRNDKDRFGKDRVSARKDKGVLALDFDVEDFYALGSPVGLFQMLKGRTIAARKMIDSAPAQTPASITEDPFLDAPSLAAPANPENSSLFEITISSPKVKQLFNIFHPTDPISYRMEPLISPAMSTLKPQPLPYTKKGIFDAPVGQGLTGIGVKVGQSVSGLWTSFSAGIASSLLNRSLGIVAEDPARAASSASATASLQRTALSTGSGTNIAGGVIPVGPVVAKRRAPTDDQRRLNEGSLEAGVEGERPPTLIDSDLDTLYAGFQKRKKVSTGDAGMRDIEDESLEERDRKMEETVAKLQREEARVRALNSNGRVDYNIQEGAFDISLIASIASHLSYWADEDVSHFVISQLLSRQRVLKRVGDKEQDSA